MISSINSVQSTDLMDTVRQITQTSKSSVGGAIGKTDGTNDPKAPSFGEMLSGLIKSVDDKQKVAQADAKDVMTGKSDNIHQAILSMQEAGVAFSLMSEVRNKLVSAYQELMRMQV